jgi:hypothetical protein
MVMRSLDSPQPARVVGKRGGRRGNAANGGRPARSNRAKS